MHDNDGGYAGTDIPFITIPIPIPSVPVPFALAPGLMPECFPPPKLMPIPMPDVMEPGLLPAAVVVGDGPVAPGVEEDVGGSRRLRSSRAS